MKAVIHARNAIGTDALCGAWGRDVRRYLTRAGRPVTCPFCLADLRLPASCKFANGGASCAHWCGDPACMKETTP